MPRARGGRYLKSAGSAESARMIMSYNRGRSGLVRKRADYFFPVFFFPLTSSTWTDTQHCILIAINLDQRPNAISIYNAHESRFLNIHAILLPSRSRFLNGIPNPNEGA